MEGLVSIEAGVVFGFEGQAIHWHLPVNRTGGSLPDSHSLWDVLWENRATVFGFAHSHPGSDVPGPSWEDVTTFAGVELGLGRRLFWPIVSRDHLSVVVWGGPGKYDYVTYPVGIGAHNPSWLDELRRHSNY
jgi:hypothetical protein